MPRDKKVMPMHRETYTDKKLTLPPLAAFDFETDGLGGRFIIGAVWTTDGIKELFYSLADFFAWMVAHPQYRYLAHNAVGYEFAYLYPLIYQYFEDNEGVEIEPTIQGDNRVVQLRITIPREGEYSRRGKPIKDTIDIRDTLCLFSMSLEKVAKAFCPELPKLKGNIDFEKETFDPNNPLHIEYVYRDCEIVLIAYERHAANIREVFGVPLGVTAGSTALKAFKSTIKEGHVYYRVNEQADAFIRKAYYGGLVLPGHMVGNWGRTGSGDINGAYGYQMKAHQYPVGSPFATHFYHPGMIGFYQVIATVPFELYDTLGFNPVPCRLSTGLCWPSGTFETYISSPEIEYARDKGCTIDILCGYVFPRSEEIFTEFIDKCQEMEWADNFRRKPSIKQVRNSGYGKFGSKQVHKTIKFSKETLVGYMPLMREDNGQIIDGLYVGEESTEADYMMPHWAALITAYERLYLMQFIEECYRRGAKNVYCDTDSIKTDLHIIGGMIEDGFIPIGDFYGQFKVEETCENFIVLGSKCFYGSDERGNKMLMKAKGVPNRVLSEQTYLDAVEALTRPLPKSKKLREADSARSMEFYSVKSVMEIIKENSHVRPVKRNRKITDIRNSASWSLAGDSIRPRILTHAYSTG